MPSLFEIGTEYHRLVELLTTSDGELPDEVAAEFEARFAEFEADAAEKADAYISVIRSLQTKAAALKAQADQYQAEADRFKKAANTETNAADKMEERLKDFLTMTGQTKFTTAAGRKLTVKANGGKWPLAIQEQFNIDNVQAKYLKIVKTLDTDAVRDELLARKAAYEALLARQKAGEDLTLEEKVELDMRGRLAFASLAPKGTHLLIK